MRERVCLITGSTGIGAAAARRVAAEGGAVFIVSRTADHARALAAELEGGWAAADLADEGDTERAVNAAVERFGRIDGLFAVAGASGRRYGDGPIHELTAEGWDKTFEINLRTQALISRAVVRQMLAQEANSSGTRGSILLMGSVTATDPSPQFFATHAYAAARGTGFDIPSKLASPARLRPGDLAMSMENAFYAASKRARLSRRLRRDH